VTDSKNRKHSYYIYTKEVCETSVSSVSICNLLIYNLLQEKQMETDNIHLLQHLTTSISACYIKETDETDVLQTFFKERDKANDICLSFYESSLKTKRWRA
jgi:hypothetical protein